MHRSVQTIAVVIVTLTSAVWSAQVVNAENPAGIPSAAKRAVVSGHIDGDKIRVDFQSNEEVVLMAGIDAPEPGECYAGEAAQRVEELAPEGTTVYLERSGLDRDGKDRLVRYVWIPGAGDARGFCSTRA